MNHSYRDPQDGSHRRPRTSRPSSRQRPVRDLSRQLGRRVGGQRWADDPAAGCSAVRLLAWGHPMVVGAIPTATRGRGSISEGRVLVAAAPTWTASGPPSCSFWTTWPVSRSRIARSTVEPRASRAIVEDRRGGRKVGPGPGEGGEVWCHDGVTRHRDVAWLWPSASPVAIPASALSPLVTDLRRPRRDLRS